MIRFLLVASAWAVAFSLLPGLAQESSLPSEEAEKKAAPAKPVAKVAFTFDCAQWGDKGLDHILAVLKKKKVPATFFVTGKFIEFNKEGLLKIVEAGHEVANHSYEHDKHNSIEECNRVAGLYHEATGKKMSKYFRAPYLYEKGISWEYYEEQGWKKGYVSLITCDALPEYKWLDDSLFLRNFQLYVARGADDRIAIHKAPFQKGPGHINGAAILMHIDGYRFHLLEKMIEIVRRGGYECASFSEARAAKPLGNPFPERTRRTLRPVVELTRATTDSTTGTGQPSKPTLSEKMELARLADPRPDRDRMKAARDSFASYAPPEGVDIRGEISITFNCIDHSSSGLQSVLDTLTEEKVQATFYLSKFYFENYPGGVKEILERGHEVAFHSGSESTSPDDADQFARVYEKETGVQLVRLIRHSLDQPEKKTETAAEHTDRSWQEGYVSLDTCDLDEEAKEASDGSFMAYYKIYMAIAPKQLVPIIDVPYSGTGNMDGAVIMMHPDGFRNHLLGKMVRFSRERGYAIVPQSKLKKRRR